MKKIKDYEILESDNKYDLEEAVKKYIEKGYELYGSPFIFYDMTKRHEYFYQAMITYE